MRFSRLIILLFALLAIGMIAAACTSDDDEDGDAAASSQGETLKMVLDRGVIKVGVKDSQPGFGYLQPDGTFAGQDIEFARALAAALFGDKNKVEFTPASASARFELLASGEIDVLIRTTTWTSNRDMDLNGAFTGVTFYDGQGIAVNADSSINSLASSTVNDWLKSTRDLRLSRFVSLGWGLVLMVVAVMFQSRENPVVALGLQIASYTSGGLLGLFLLGRTTIKFHTAALVTGLVGAAGAVLALQGLGVAWTWYLLVATAVNMGLAIGVNWGLTRLRR